MPEESRTAEKINPIDQEYSQRIEALRDEGHTFSVFGQELNKAAELAARYEIFSPIEPRKLSNARRQLYMFYKNTVGTAQVHRRDNGEKPLSVAEREERLKPLISLFEEGNE